MHPVPKHKCFSPHLAVVFAPSIEARCYVENEDVVGAVPTGAAPTTFEWSKILLHKSYVRDFTVMIVLTLFFWDSTASRPGVGVIKQIFSIPLFFTIFKILVTDWISHSYFTGVIAAQLWWHLSNMKVIPRTYQVLLQVNKKDWKDLFLWSLTYSFHLSMVIIISQEMIHIKHAWHFEW